MGKRSLDVCLAGLALIVLSPVLLAIAAAVKLDSRGSVWFVQERVGLEGRPFRMFKFRTMVPAAERLASNVSPLGDPRVTRVGGFLRRTFLDELPQLLNVLKGDMSLVGPRPETPEFVALYTPEERRVLSVRPGMAGPATIAYSKHESRVLAGQDDPVSFYINNLMHDRLQLDLGYLDRRSLMEDARLFARQLLALVRG